MYNCHISKTSTSLNNLKRLSFLQSCSFGRNLPFPTYEMACFPEPTTPSDITRRVSVHSSSQHIDPPPLRSPLSHLDDHNSATIINIEEKGSNRLGKAVKYITTGSKTRAKRTLEKMNESDAGCENGLRKSFHPSGPNSGSKRSSQYKKNFPQVEMSDLPNPVEFENGYENHKIRKDIEKDPHLPDSPSPRKKTKLFDSILQENPKFAQSKLLPNACMSINCQSKSASRSSSPTEELLKKVLMYEAAQLENPGENILVLATCLKQYLEEVFNSLSNGHEMESEIFNILLKLLGIHNLPTDRGGTKILKKDFFRMLWEDFFKTSPYPPVTISERRQNPSLLESVLKSSRQLSALENLACSLKNINLSMDGLKCRAERSRFEKQENAALGILPEDLNKALMEENSLLRAAVNDLCVTVQKSDADNLALKVKEELHKKEVLDEPENLVCLKVKCKGEEQRVNNDASVTQILELKEKVDLHSKQLVMYRAAGEKLLTILKSLQETLESESENLPETVLPKINQSILLLKENAAEKMNVKTDLIEDTNTDFKVNKIQNNSACKIGRSKLKHIASYWKVKTKKCRKFPSNSPLNTENKNVSESISSGNSSSSSESASKKPPTKKEPLTADLLQFNRKETLPSHGDFKGNENKKYFSNSEPEERKLNILKPRAPSLIQTGGKYSSFENHIGPFKPLPSSHELNLNKSYNNQTSDQCSQKIDEDLFTRSSPKRTNPHIVVSKVSSRKRSPIGSRAVSRFYSDGHLQTAPPAFPRPRSGLRPSSNTAEEAYTTRATIGGMESNEKCKELLSSSNVLRNGMSGRSSRQKQR